MVDKKQTNNAKVALHMRLKKDLSSDEKLQIVQKARAMLGSK